MTKTRNGTIIEERERERERERSAFAFRQISSRRAEHSSRSSYRSDERNCVYSFARIHRVCRAYSASGAKIGKQLAAAFKGLITTLAGSISESGRQDGAQYQRNEQANEDRRRRDGGEDGGPPIFYSCRVDPAFPVFVRESESRVRGRRNASGHRADASFRAMPQPRSHATGGDGGVEGNEGRTSRMRTGVSCKYGNRFDRKS